MLAVVLAVSAALAPAGALRISELTGSHLYPLFRSGRYVDLPKLKSFARHGIPSSVRGVSLAPHSSWAFAREGRAQVGRPSCRHRSSS